MVGSDFLSKCCFLVVVGVQVLRFRCLGLGGWACFVATIDNGEGLPETSRTPGWEKNNHKTEGVGGYATNEAQGGASRLINQAFRPLY